MSSDPFDDGTPGHQRPAIFASGLANHLLLVANFGGTVSEGERMESLQRAFQTWPSLCRAMARLEQLHPERAAAGQALDERVVDYLERRAEQEGDA